MGPAASCLDALTLSADQCAIAENEFRSQIAARIKRLNFDIEKERSFAVMEGGKWVEIDRRICLAPIGRSDDFGSRTGTW